MPASKLQPLPHEKLRRTFDPALVPFETSDEAAACQESVLGQNRAKDALEFGLSIRDMDYHVYVAGPQRTGKTHLVRTFVEKIAAGQPQPDDWVYVYNFRQPDQPRCLRFPPGQGRVFAKEMADLLEDFKVKIPEIFEGEEYNRQKEGVVGEFKRMRSAVFSALDKQAREQGYVLRFEPTGIMVLPADEEGNPLPEQTIREMDEEQREQLRAKSDIIQGKVAESLRMVGAQEKELGQAMAKLDQELVLAACTRLMQDLADKYAELAQVLLYLEQVRGDVGENYKKFSKSEQPQMPFAMPDGEPQFREYEVNVLVDNSETEGAPVIVENNPTFPNLFGRIERQAQFGALITDFTLLRPGALHKANGGYLVLPIRELLMMWLPWEALKRCLRERKVTMEDVMESLGYMVTRSLRPEPIPLDLKVILVGDSQIFPMLYNYDNQFSKLFKVKAEMAERMDFGDSEVAQFISHMCQLSSRRDLPPLHRGAVARLVELAAELSGDSERLTLRLAEVEDILRESAYYASAAGHRMVMAEDVVTAVDKRRHRANMIEDRMQEGLVRGFINVETSGAVVGQINGLAVLDIGDYAFGKPSRITATVGMGKEGVVALDRESDLSGPFHTKGVLILAGFLRNRFAAKMPLSLTASLVFEQSYSMIDGDSASLAETLALLSSLSGVPLRQDLAITGSVSQQGQAQAIGGVNYKIDGFFRLCQDRGLTGTQGVVIPKSNVVNLMLHDDVVEAARQGKFHIYAVDHVDQALELFTGMPAGQRNKKGNFPRGSINYLVEKQFKKSLEIARELAGGQDKK